MSQNIQLLSSLYNSYESYKELSITDRRFKHRHIQPLIDSLRNDSRFEVTQAGVSAEGRSISLIKYGSGGTVVFMWSQMHGDEPTATMALFDIFNFLRADDSFNPFREEIKKNLTLYFLPMVNPDGAEVFTRRNSYSIDINRDAINLQTPEARILKKVFEDVKAQYGFNLHDQNPRYSAGNSYRAAALTFLAPSYNTEKEVNDVRGNAMRLIGKLFEELSLYIPGHIAKYSDGFEPRAFGDNFQKWGMSTVLIESGGWKDDYEKQFIRKLNYYALLSSFSSIMHGYHLHTPMAVYDSIPFNDDYIYDLILRKVTLNRNNKDYLVDVAINKIETATESGEIYFRSEIMDIGDLSTFYGLEEVDLTGRTIIPGKTYIKEFENIEEVESIDFNRLYAQGFINVKVKDAGDSEVNHLPVNISTKKIIHFNEEIKIGKTANFVIMNGDQAELVVINGFLYNILEGTGIIKNGLLKK